LFGEYWKVSPFSINIAENLNCTRVCSLKTTTDARNPSQWREFLLNMAKNEYHYKLMVDELISATIIKTESDEKDYFKGIPVAKHDPVTSQVYMYNHLDLFVSINRAADGTERIVEFDVQPKSIDWSRSVLCDLKRE
jgi:hypothetical protein